MKKFKNFITESHDEEVGELLLIYDGQSPTTWYFIQDAINDGLLDEKLQLDNETIEQYGKEVHNENYIDMESITDMILYDFDEELDLLFDWMINNDLLDKKPTVEIEGYDEDGEEYEFSYFPE